MLVWRYLGSHVLETIETGALKVSKVSNFNDPFEFRCRAVGQLGVEAARRHVMGRVKDPTFRNELRKLPEFAGLSKKALLKKFKAEAETASKSLTEDAADIFQDQIEQTHSVADRTTRVLCCSATYSDELQQILQWSHYTNNHQGARLWIDTEKARGPLGQPYEVEYDNEPIELDISRLEDTKYMYDCFRAAMTTKATCWSYEQEVRFFVPKGFFKEIGKRKNPIEVINFEPEDICRIDFGIRFDSEISSQVIEAVGKNDRMSVDFYQASIDPRGYNIRYIKL